MRNLLFALTLALSFSANAVVIDNSAWTGSINNGWDQSAQTLSFATDVTLNSFGWWLGQANTHQVSVVEWSGGPGATLYSSTQAWNAGYNEIFPNANLSAGTLYAVWFDYLGNTSSTVYYNDTNGYADGEWWLNSGGWFPWSNGNDIPFIATINEADGGSVPEPTGLALLGLGLAGLGYARRKRTA